MFPFVSAVAWVRCHCEKEKGNNLCGLLRVLNFFFLIISKCLLPRVNGNCVRLLTGVFLRHTRHPFPAGLSVCVASGCFFDKHNYWAASSMGSMGCLCPPCWLTYLNLFSYHLPFSFLLISLEILHSPYFLSGCSWTAFLFPLYYSSLYLNQNVSC